MIRRVLFMGLLVAGPLFAMKEGGYYYPQGVTRGARLDIGYTWTTKWNDLKYGFNVSDPVSYNWPGSQQNDHLYKGGLWVGAKYGGTVLVSSAFYDNEFESCGAAASSPTGFIYVGPQKSAKDALTEACEKEGVNGGTPIGVRVFERTLSWPNYPYNMFFGHEYYIIFENPPASRLDEVYVSVWFDADVCGAEGGGRFWYTDMTAYDGLYNAAYLEDPRYGEISDKMGRVDEYTILADTAYPGSDGVLDGYFVWGDEVEERVISAKAGFDTTNLPTLPDGRKYMYLIPNNMSYLYTSPENPEAYEKCGYIFASLIYADPTENDSVLPDGGRIVRPHSHQWWTIETDPDAGDIYQWEYMTGRAPKTFFYRFAPRPDVVGGPYFDYRFLLTVGPYRNVAQGDTIKLVFVTGVGKGLNGGPNVWDQNKYYLGIRQLVQYAYRAYYSGSQSGDPGHPTPPAVTDPDDDHWRVPMPPPSPTLNYSAVPGRVDLVWDNLPETTPDLVTGDIDFAGYVVFRSLYVPAFDMPVINSEGFNPGEVKAIIFKPGLTDEEKQTILSTMFGLGADALVDSFVNAGVLVLDTLVWSYTDTNVTSGYPYYYAVGAFDYVEGQGSLLSSLDNYRKDVDGNPVPIFVPTEASTTAWKDNVRIVPNPFNGSSAWSATKIAQEVEFQNLPPSARIDVFTLSGDHIITLYHNDPVSGSLRWNLLTKNGNIIAPGIYMIKVSDSNGDYKILKFMVLR